MKNNAVIVFDFMVIGEICFLCTLVYTTMTQQEPRYPESNHLA